MLFTKLLFDQSLKAKETSIVPEYFFSILIIIIIIISLTFNNILY